MYYTHIHIRFDILLCTHSLRQRHHGCDCSYYIPLNRSHTLAHTHTHARTSHTRTLRTHTHTNRSSSAIVSSQQTSSYTMLLAAHTLLWNCCADTQVGASPHRSAIKPSRRPGTHSTVVRAGATSFNESNRNTHSIFQLPG